MATQKGRIYTRTGDDGMTSPGDGTRISKASVRVTALGEIDELNCLLGLVRVKSGQADIETMLGKLQHTLFNIGSDLSVGEYSFSYSACIDEMEKMMDRWTGELDRLDSFILPGGNEAAALCHIARAVCRRAERQLIELHRVEPIRPEVRALINRLSDLLFVAARLYNHRDGTDDVPWDKLAWTRSDPHTAEN